MKRNARHWLAVKKAVAERDNSQCVLCGCPANDVHHVIFRSHGGKDDVNNCVCLCRQCHELAHGTNARKIRNKLQEILTERNREDEQNAR